MSKIKLTSDYPHNYINVPYAFIDTYLADANGEFVKVYLYLLRCMGASSTECSISAIADLFNNTEKDILRALKYWEKVGVLNLTFDSKKELTGLCFKELTTAPVANEEPAETSVPPEKSTAIEKKEYSLDEIKVFQNNHELSELIYIIETYLKHTLSSSEINTVFFWYDGLHFSGELIEYLVEYCITNGHSSLRYMDKVAFGWAESKIDTIEKAKEQISVRSKAYYNIIKAFGISGRNLADSEMAYVNKWSKEYVFDLELIQEACRRTIAATQKPSFEYADTILTKWYQNKVRNMKDVAALDEIYKIKNSAKAVQTNITAAKPNKFNNFQQRNYDSNELERLLLTTSVQ